MSTCRTQQNASLGTNETWQSSAKQGPSIREIDFLASATTIRRYRAEDFFNESSFVPFEAPGPTGNLICRGPKNSSEDAGKARDLLQER